jgi:hypothetical protein
MPKSPAASDTSSLSPPPSSLSSLSPPPGSTPSSPTPQPPPKKARTKKAQKQVNGGHDAKPAVKRKKKSTEEKLPKIKLKLKLAKQDEGGVVKKAKKPREQKLEAVERSVVNNFDVPLVVLFRAKFRSLFTGTAELGPQDVEEGCALDEEAGSKAAEFIMRICALIMNRRKTAEYLPVPPLFGLWMEADCRVDQLDRVVQETTDSCFANIGFKRDGLPYHPFQNVAFATLDWDARVAPPPQQAPLTG